MNGILGMAELALEAELTLDEMRHFMAVVKSSAEALLTIINDILDFSKSDACKQTLESISYSLRDTVFDALKSLAIKADAKRLELSCEVEESIPDDLIGDAGRVRQIIVNLVGNALKFTDNGEIILRVALEASNQLHFSVKDSGIGIHDEKQRMIFEPFTQGDGSATRKYGGTGLGLTICRQLVELMNGRIWLDSSTSSGSTFHFVIPLCVDVAVESDHQEALQGAGEQVLVLDDNATSLEIVGRMLSSLGMIPTLVNNVSEALVALRRAEEDGRQFRLIMVDERMPDLDGFEFCRVLRQANESTVVVMMLTSAFSRQDALRSRELHIATHITKPFSRRELTSALNAAMRSKDPVAVVPATMAKNVAPTAAARRLHILVAEDNEVNQELMHHVLTRNGHSVTLATDGNQALAALKCNSYDLILMDVQMPRLDGIQTTAAIRAGESNTANHIPIIAITAYALKGDREKFLAAGMDEYLAKPLKARELLQMITALTSGSRDRELHFAGSASTLFNRRELLDHVDQDLSVLQRMISILAEAIPTKMSAIESAIHSRNGAELKPLVHKLRGSLSSFYAETATQALLDLESAIAESDFASARKRYSDLKSILDRLTPELMEFSQSSNGG